MVRVVPTGGDRFIRLTLGGKAVVNTNQDDLAKTHIIGKLEGGIGDGGTFPQAPGGIFCKDRLRVGCIKKKQIFAGLQPLM